MFSDAARFFGDRDGIECRFRWIRDKGWIIWVQSRPIGLARNKSIRVFRAIAKSKSKLTLLRIELRCFAPNIQ